MQLKWVAYWLLLQQQILTGPRRTCYYHSVTPAKHAEQIKIVMIFSLEKHNCEQLNSVLGTKENFCSSFLNEFPLRLVRCFMIPPANSKKRNDVEGIIYHQPDRGLDEGKVERKKNGKQANWSWLEKIILDFNKCAARSNARAQECSLLVSESLSALGMSGRRSADRRPRKIMC